MTRACSKYSWRLNQRMLMTDLEQAHFAGFVEGTEIVLAQLERCLREHDPRDCILLKLVRDEVALVIAERMKDV